MSQFLSIFRRNAERSAGPDAAATGQNLDADGYWSWAEARSTASAYRCFAFHHPKDPRVAAARAKGAALECAEIEKSGKPADCRRFLRAYPDSEFVERVKHRHAKLAAEAPAVLHPPDTALARRAVQVLERGLRSDDHAVRCFAAQVLGREDAVTIAALIRAFESDEVTLCSTAVGRLAAMQNPEVQDYLIRALKDTNYGVRKWAGDALQVAGDDRAVGPLIAALGDPKWLVRSNAMDALGEIADPRAVEAVSRRLDSNDQFERGTAAECLGKIGDLASMGSLFKASDDGEETVRAHACAALSRIGGGGALQRVARAARSDTGYVRVYAARSLKEFGIQQAGEALRAALEDELWEVRSAAAQSLARMKLPAANAVLDQAALSPDLRVRTVSLWALGRQVEDAGIGALCTALRDRDDAKRRDAAKGLSDIATDRTVDGLINATRDTNYFVRSSAADGLGKTGATRAIPALVRLLDDPEWYVSCQVPIALGKIGGLDATQALLTRLRTGLDDLVRARIVDALATIAVKAGVDPLRAALRDQDPNVRRAASEALAKVARQMFEAQLEREKTAAQAGDGPAGSQPDALTRLNELVENSGDAVDVPLDVIDHIVKAAAGQTLAAKRLLEIIQTKATDSMVKIKSLGAMTMLGKDSAIGELKTYLRSEKIEERVAAAQALSHTRSQDVTDELLHALDDVDPLVRVHIAAAILDANRGPLASGTDKTPADDGV
jgi:HEAT repeat protein